MNRKLNVDIVTLGRVLGVVIIVVGFALSAWETIDLSGNPYYSDGAVKLRYFLQRALAYLGSGGLLLVAAEIADRLGWGAGDDVPDGEEPLATQDTAQ